LTQLLFARLVFTYRCGDLWLATVSKQAAALPRRRAKSMLEDLEPKSV
jgi:hypothetical protein